MGHRRGCGSDSCRGCVTDHWREFWKPATRHAGEETLVPQPHVQPLDGVRNRAGVQCPELFQIHGRRNRLVGSFRLRHDCSRRGTALVGSFKNPLPPYTYDAWDAQPYTSRLVFFNKNTGRLLRRRVASVSMKAIAWRAASGSKIIRSRVFSLAPGAGSRIWRAPVDHGSGRNRCAERAPPVPPERRSNQASVSFAKSCLKRHPVRCLRFGHLRP